jgi:hypothetical protein
LTTSPLDTALIRVVDSITKLGEEFRGAVLVAGSHGGRYCGYLTALAGLRGVILNDAGVGKDNAGIGALPYLEALGVPAAVISHQSARIGDGTDMMARGKLSHVNAPARALGCAVGEASARAAAKLAGGAPYVGDVPEYREARSLLDRGATPIIVCDSASLVTADDAGAFIVTGSHGGILAGRPGYGLAATARGAVFNDAGVGIENAGLARLAVLDAAGTAAVTVSSQSACIGDGISAWENGLVSHTNTHAADLGVAQGWTVQQFAKCFS